MKALGILFAAGLLGMSAQADATIYLGMQIGDGAIVNMGNDGGSGNLTYSGLNYGGFVNSIIVQGFPTMDQPALQTASINTKKGAESAAASLSIYITQTDLNPVSGSLLSSFTSNTFQGSAVSVQESTLLSTSNALFGGTVLASKTFTGLGSQDYVTPVPTLTGPFSETTKYVLTAGVGASSFNDTINISSAPGAVPEPASWALMIVGFGTVGPSLRQRRRATVSFG